MHVRDSITQSTTLCTFDPALKFEQPHLMIVSHKVTPNLKETAEAKKAMPRLA